MWKCVSKAGIAALLAGLLPGIASAQKPPLTIGIVTGQLQNSTAQSFAPFTDWMDAHVPGQSIERLLPKQDTAKPGKAEPDKLD